MDDLERLYDLCFVGSSDPAPTDPAPTTSSNDAANGANNSADAPPLVPDHLAELASDIGVLTPEQPSLSAAELDDLAAINGLTGVIAFLEHMVAVESEVVESEAWNYETSVQLIELGKRFRRIPFGGETSKLFDINPSFASFSAAAAAAASKGKGKERETPTSRPKSRTIFNLHPKESMDSWLGNIPGKSQIRNFYFAFVFYLII
jgi:hypothetical protein